MKKMKLLRLFLVTLFFAFGLTETQAQVFKFKADSFSVLEKDQNDKWGKWSKFEPSTVLITLDGDKDRVVVNSQEIQLYRILAYGEKLVTEDDETIPMKCADNDGGLCTILIVTRKNQNNRKQFYINYDDVKIVYNVYNSN